MHAAYALLLRCEQLLAELPTSLDDDLQTLAGLGISPCDVNAAIAHAAIGDAPLDPPGSGASDGAADERLMADEIVAIRFRASKKMVLTSAMRWLRDRYMICRNRVEAY